VATISRTVLREQVKDVLLQRIVSGELQPGDRLVETRIAQELGTSQAPVREALRDLELLRLVESEPFRGSRVRVIDEEEMIDVFPVRASLEELAARLAAEKLEGDVSVLEVELEAMRDAVKRGDTNALARHDIAFHQLIVEAAGNPVLEQCWKSLGVESPITVSLYGVTMDPEQAADRHLTLIDAIRSGNANAAGREARKHVEVSAGLMRTQLKSAGA
jgi:DNA-binding GntR family transcriptional regulator